MKIPCKLLCLLTGLLLVGSALAQTATQPTPPEEPETHIVEGPRVLGENLQYSTGGQTYQGYLAYDANAQEAGPAVLVVHEWWGLNEYTRTRAEQLAALGFVAFAVDMYGGGQVTTHPGEAGEFAKQVMSDWPGARAKLEAAMARLAEHSAVDEERIAAIGYCFGGGVVMNMALAGMPIEAAISFHGSPTQAVVTPQAFDGIVEIHNGVEDPMVEEGALQSMAQTLEAQGADIRIVNYPGATHGFTNPDADRVAVQHDLPLGYDAAADAASWQSALLALDRALNGG